MTILETFVGPTMARPIFQLSTARSRANLHRLTPEDSRRLLRELGLGLRHYLKDPPKQAECMKRLELLLMSGAEQQLSNMQRGAEVIPITVETDIVKSRTRGREICRDLGFPTVSQIKVATAISELARNMIQYAGGGQVRITRLEGSPRGLEITASDHGPGITNLDQILAGRYVSKTGMGMGLSGCRNLVDEFDVQTTAGAGTTVTLRKYLR